MRTKDLVAFRTWLEDVCITPEALDLVRGLDWNEVAGIAVYLAENGIAFQDGVPVPDDEDRLWEALDEAMVQVCAERAARWE